MLKTSTVSKRHQLVSASHSVFSGWTNTGGHGNSAHKRIKSAQILSSPVSLGLPNFLSPHQHPLTPVTNARQRDARDGEGGGDGSHSGNEFHFVFSDLFTSCLPSLGRLSEISFRLTFRRLPHRPFSPPDSGRLCLCLCRPFASSVPSSAADSYLRVSTLLFVYCACGFTPALLIIPRTTENTSAWVMSQSLSFFFFFLQQSQPSVECQVLSLPLINFLNDWAQLIIMTPMKRNTF